MKPVLEIKNISKKYNIQANNKPYLSLRESLFSFLKPGTKKEEFWALKDVSFDVDPGDTVGIIGKNGAGKSTLLKILSKITPPTSGNIKCRGRIASLLEVGTGFHAELSGRENIFMNGSILGMRRSEIAKNFDAIVDFSGVEKFINTPLKHYSSGMQLRLAFAVAAFLENEILVIDEVLAVGDAEFQKKCIGKMGDVSKSGRTILFVSHQMGAIGQLCKKGIFLQDGTVTYSGTASDTIDYYLSKNNNPDNTIYTNKTSPGSEEIYFEKIWACDESGNNKSEFSFTEAIHMRFELKNAPLKPIKIGIAMLDKYGNRLFSDYFTPGDNGNIQVALPEKLFAPNSYSFLVALLKNDEVVFVEENICQVKIIDIGSDFARFEGYNYGYIIANCKWGGF